MNMKIAKPNAMNIVLISLFVMFANVAIVNIVESIIAASNMLEIDKAK